jgi:hypothetical protein
MGVFHTYALYSLHFIKLPNEMRRKNWQAEEICVGVEFVLLKFLKMEMTNVAVID